MTLKCVQFQIEKEGHEALFKENPEKYLVELMRYDSAVTSVTETLAENETLVMEGRTLKFAQGTPVQLVLATANRDPTFWKNPDGFNPQREQLAETLSWNGRVASVEARSFKQAPRHCPGHCLSLKIGAAICSAMMGSFEELHAAGKVLKNGGNVQCNNFNPHREEPTLWEPTGAAQAAEQPVDYSTGEKLVKKGHQCSSNEYVIGSAKTPGQCAVRVKAAGGKFFAFGGKSWLSGKGKCQLEFTNSSECPQGFTKGNFDFYDIPSVPLNEALVCRVKDVSVSVVDGGEDVHDYIKTVDNYLNATHLATWEGQVDHTFSLFRDKICKKDYWLMTEDGGLVVKTYQGCCSPECSWSRWGYKCDDTCVPPAPRGKDGSVESSEVLLKQGESYQICPADADSSFTVDEGILAKVGGDNSGHCIDVAVRSRTVTLEEAVDKCPLYVKWVIDALGHASKASYALTYNLIPSSSRNHPIAKLLGKDPESSSLGPAFDLYTTGWYVLMKSSLTSFSGGDLPASQRVPLPTKQGFVDRWTVGDFVGMPSQDIDQSKDLQDQGAYQRFDGVTVCAVDVFRHFDFDDGFKDNNNSWDSLKVDQTILGVSDCPDGLNSCTKKQFMEGFFSKYTTGDGAPAYPTEEIDFRGLFYNSDDGMWSDEAEKFIAWSHYGTVLLDPVHDKGSLKFAIRTNDLSGLTVRPQFSRIGADMYFDEQGNPAMIETPAPDSHQIWKSEAEPATWQYWKFAWRSSTFLKLTAVNHLWATHFTAANAMAAASREGLPHSHPLRRLMSIFTFGTIGVNNNAFHQLLGPNGLLHRSSPFFDFVDVNNALFASLPSLEDHFGHFVSEERMNDLPQKIKDTPYIQDGQLFFNEIQSLVSDWVDLYPDWCQDGILVDPDVKYFWERARLWSNYRQHFVQDAKFLGMIEGSGIMKCDGFKKGLAIYFFHVTGYHRQVGTVADVATDPDFAGFSWKEGDAFVSPRQAAQLLYISASTATKWPKISQDYSFVAEGIEKQAGAENILRKFKTSMDELRKTIDERNSKRAQPYNQMHPDWVECSVAV
jgi:hypothetical protein